MTDKEAIKYLQQLYPNGGHCWLDDQRIEAVGMAIKALQKESASEELEEAANNAVIALVPSFGQKYSDGSYVSSYRDCFKREELLELFKAGAKWQKEHLWKPADGEDLPEINREVIALLGWCKVVFAHRPPEYWDGKDIVTGKVTRHYPKTYDKGGWNIPNVKYWLDVELPKEIEL